MNEEAAFGCKSKVENDAKAVVMEESKARDEDAAAIQFKSLVLYMD